MSPPDSDLTLRTSYAFRFQSTVTPRNELFRLLRFRAALRFVSAASSATFHFASALNRQFNSGSAPLLPLRNLTAHGKVDLS